MRRRKILASVPSIAAVSTFGVGSVTADNKSPKRTITEISDVSFSSDNVDPSVELVQENMDKDQTALISYELQVKNNGGCELSWSAPNSVNAIFGERNRGNKQAIFIGENNTWERSSDGIWKADKDMLENGEREDMNMSEDLSKNQTFINRLQLWTGPGNGNNNLPSGRYKFSRDYTIEDSTGSSDAEFSFEIEIEN